jgi:hypothetical protein
LHFRYQVLYRVSLGQCIFSFSAQSLVDDHFGVICQRKSGPRIRTEMMRFNEWNVLSLDTPTPTVVMAFTMTDGFGSKRLLLRLWVLPW